MNRLRSSSIAASALTCILLHAGSAMAHQGEIVYPMFELPSSELPDLHDGTLEDWDAVLPDASLTHHDFIWQGNAVASIAVEDMAFRVFLAWHYASQRIFIGFEGIDDEYVPLNEETVGNGSVGILVDGDHSGGLYQYYTQFGHTEEEQRRLFGSQAQDYHARGQARDGRHLFVGSWAMWANEPPWADIGVLEVGESPTLTILEMSLTAWDDLHPDGPDASRRSELIPGDIIGLNVSVTDFDLQEPRAPDGFFYLARPAMQERTGNFLNSGFSDNSVDVELIPCDHGDCSGGSSGTAIRSDSWGRIKVGLQ